VNVEWMVTASGVEHAFDGDAPLAGNRGLALCGRPLEVDLFGDEDGQCAGCIAAVETPCGTYGGYQRHRRHKTEICEPCRKANADYHARRRELNPDLRLTDRRGEAARARARRRLSEEFEARYRELLNEERAR
jgi:hypothetical protein